MTLLKLVFFLRRPNGSFVVGITFTDLHAEPAIVALLGASLDSAVSPASYSTNRTCIETVGKAAPAAVSPLP